MTDRHAGTVMSAPGDKTMNMKIAGDIVAASFAIASPGSAATMPDSSTRVSVRTAPRRSRSALPILIMS